MNDKWISVTERLPDKSGEVLVCTRHNFYKTQNIAKANFKKHSGGFYGQGGTGRMLPTGWNFLNHRRR